MQNNKLEYIPAARLGRRQFLGVSLASLVSLTGCSLSNDDNLSRKLAQRITFGSCADQDFPQPIWDVIGKTNPDAFLFIGDNIYADTEDMALIAKRYGQLAAKPEFARFRERFPILATWDDHDFGINDGGVEYPKKEESKKIMLDFFGEPTNSVRRSRPGVYTSAMLGPRGADVQVILLDLRWWRTPLLRSPDGESYIPNPDPHATILGTSQWRWLEEQLRMPARVRLIASSTQFVSPEHPWEKWANFPYEKQRMLSLLDRLNIRNAVFLSGDMHYGEFSQETTPGGIPVYDLTSSGLNYAEAGAHYANRYRLAIHDTTPNFGVVEFDWHRREVGVSLQVRNDAGETVIRKDIVIR